MKAVVLEYPCRADELHVSEVPMPQVKPGWVLVKIKAFGINRSEIFTRQGDSPSVKLPKIMGIECVGEVEDPSDSVFQKGQKIVSLMGGLGRQFDGSYAEYTLIPSAQIYPIETNLDWAVLAAIPEMYYTAYASLFENLLLKNNDILLIRGGTSSVGLAALQLAKSIGATVISTTRNKEKIEMLQKFGADFVLLDDREIKEELYSLFPNGVSKLLELVGTVTIKDSLQLLKEQGILCMTGILGGKWTIENFEPMSDIPSGRYLTQFDSEHVKERLVTDLFTYIEQNNIKVPIAEIFSLDEINEAHRLMEKNCANGKIVIVNK